MTPNEINALLVLTGKTKKQVAADLCAMGFHCTESDLVKTINGHQKNRRIRRGFAQRFGLSEKEVFGADFEVVISLRAPV